MLETLLNEKQGIPTLLASIVVVMGLHLLFKVGEFLWEMLKKKTEVSEKSIENLTGALQKTTEAVRRLDDRLVEIEKDLSQMPKIRLDLRRMFSAIKHLAGENWKEIREIIMEDQDLSS